MKKFLLSATIIIIASLGAAAQPVLLEEHFDTYDGTTGSIPAGFYISWNSVTPTKSFYDVASGNIYCGQSCNSYKFGVDSATIITPAFANAGSVSFYLKGNGLNYQPNQFKVFESPDSINWNPVVSIDSIPSDSMTHVYPINQSSTRLKFYYKKDSLGYNAGFDDLYVYGPLGINENKGLQAITFYPSPTSGIVTINFNQNHFGNVEMDVINILGKEVKHYDLKNISSKQAINISDQPEGIYLFKIKSGTDEMVKRIILKR